MHGFSVNGYKCEETTKPTNYYTNDCYSSCPYDQQNRSIFDYERPQLEESRNRWLDDFGWL